MTLKYPRQFSEDMTSGRISVISVQEVNRNEDTEKIAIQDCKFAFKHVSRACGIPVIGIVGCSVLFAIPWTTIPRTDSIIHQSHWMEFNIPGATHTFLGTGVGIIALSKYTKEESLMSIWNFSKVCLFNLITWNLLYISAYLVWSVYLQFNHPLPNMAYLIVPALVLNVIGLWFILPSNALAKKEFRKKLQIYMFYCLWIVTSTFPREILSHLFANVPARAQFFIPFIVAGFRELDMRLRSKLVTKMMGIKDEAAIALLSISVISLYSFFIAIRLVGAELATLCCTVGIEFFLHLKITHQIIQEHRRVNNAVVEIVHIGRNTKITTLLIAELVETITPIIYATCIAMAYYGPNAQLFSNIGNSYWSEEIKDINQFFSTMLILFALDMMSLLFNAFYLWKSLRINALTGFCRVLEKYWYIMAIFLAYYMITYFVGNDINLGLDETMSFQWISNEGWIKLVNTSSFLSSDEKIELISKAMLH